MTTDQALSLLVAVARHASVYSRDNDVHREPQEGDLVVEVTKFGSPDPDAIGFLQGHGEATYSTDNTGPSREVWDIRPLSGKGKGGVQRWENSEFRVVPFSPIAKALVESLRGGVHA